ncbi:MAG: alpha-amylase family protein [Armatimonadota bacterium]
MRLNSSILWPTCALALLASCPVIAAPAEVVTMDSLKWYTPDRDFKPIEPAPWVLDGVQKAFVSCDMSDPKSVAYIDELIAMGVTVMHTGGPSPYYPLHNTDPNSGPTRRERDGTKKAYDYMHTRGMRVIAGILAFAPPEMVKAHPEWQLKPTRDAKPVDPFSNPQNILLRSLSMNSPWGDYMIDNIAEMMKEYGFDGVSFDGNYHPQINFTPCDIQMFEAETGRKFPKKIDLNDINYKVYLLWADQKLENWYRKLHERLRTINPQAAVYTWTTNAGRYGHYLTTPRVMSARMNLLLDSPVQEWWLDEVNLGASVVPAFGAAYVRAVNGNRVGASEPYIMSRGNPYSASGFPGHELTVRCLMAMTNGGITPIATPSVAGKEAGDNALREIGKRKKWFTRATQVPWAGLLVSEQTRQFYAGDKVVDRFLAHALGVYRVGWEEHLPITLITDMDLTAAGLKPYKVVFLPNAAALSDAQVAVIRGYVKNGGGLVATCETSLFNELGQMRGNFALSDVFGVDYLGRPAATTKRADIDPNFARSIDDSYWAKRVGAAEIRWGGGSDAVTDALVNIPRLKDVSLGIQTSFKGPMVVVSTPRLPMQQALVMFPESLAYATSYPAVAMGEFGKGRVVYMAAGFDASCYSYCYPYQRLFVAQSLEWAARVKPDIAVDAPMCIQSTFFRQKNETGERLVVQLFNGINSTTDHGLPDTNVPLREEIVPVHDIKVRFRNIAAKRVHIEPEGVDLTPVTKGEWTEVAIPPLAIHSMVVIEL